MIVKTFVLKPQSIDTIAELCDAQTIAVIRPQRKIETVFREAIGKTIREKKQADVEMAAIRGYFQGMAEDAAYQQDVEKTVDAISTYLREAMYVQTSPEAIEDYVLAKCSRLCAEAVNQRVKGTLIDGTELMLCSASEGGEP